ncbi:MAG: imidazole glycerol phosphate synthase subunit HisH [Corynebacterium variabile]|uniref:imidazole glycerol phosphate synthase subunit HisH n=1 Tax=Corynebacterium variabile TaxID=1727 RepID=UPI0026489F84|nr:imidazole glycerol phosphate synthase subunit HisH [Corynebacterium variabile]MDN6240156.1 imidazole glycerol phosphate synthase subunit HisH [Corynebacterium variabile]MDN6476857.1 imidazole glycerol phosphate synthase subunit HisH [Corynebacterium variabile]MDN6536505.1 imidazole glycerol phosphate synthase subunit HisH [Corynebacterium variabile]MDN6618446.1 imidazole glycerol phosphate synthase subunit HisH [Corynebacterium variabile]MDN6676180.1 imidazole glycerol phosphate synthase su
MATPRVALLDYGSGNVRSAQRALEHVGAEVTVTADPDTVLNADGLLVPGVGNFGACMTGLRAVHGDRMIDIRLSGGRPVFGICVGMQILFDYGVEGSDGDGPGTEGCGQWPGSVTKLEASVLPHMGWNTLEAADGSGLFAGADPAERYYFVHSYAARNWELVTDGRTEAPKVTWAQHEDCRFVAAVENGPLWATQFHPEKSGEAGAQLLHNWLATL